MAGSGLVREGVALLRALLANLLDLDRERLRCWLFARCVVESLDSPDLAAVARAMAPR